MCDSLNTIKEISNLHGGWEPIYARDEKGNTILVMLMREKSIIPMSLTVNEKEDVKKIGEIWESKVMGIAVDELLRIQSIDELLRILLKENQKTVRKEGRNIMSHIYNWWNVMYCKYFVTRFINRRHKNIIKKYNEINKKRRKQK
jgi:hypothetical protein